MFSNFNYEQSLSILVCIWDSKLTQDIELKNILCNKYKITEEDIIDYKLKIKGGK